MEKQTLSWERLFEKIGLSKYETRIYISLVVEGPSIARKLSMSSGVPRTKAYGVLRKLVQRGLVIEIPGEHSKFSIESPAESFNAFLQSLKNELSEEVTSIVESENAISLLEEIHKKRQMIKPLESQMGDVWFIQGREEILRRIETMLSRAKKTVDILTTENGLILLYKTFNRLLDKLSKKNIETRIKSPIGPSNGSLVRELRYRHKVEHADVYLPVIFMCVDKREILLIHLDPDDFNPKSMRDFGFFSQNLTLCNFFSSLFHFPHKRQREKSVTDSHFGAVTPHLHKPPRYNLVNRDGSQTT